MTSAVESPQAFQIWPSFDAAYRVAQKLNEEEAEAETDPASRWHYVAQQDATSQRARVAVFDESRQFIAYV